MLVEAFRSLRAARGVTAFILFILTVTISAATVTFSVVDAVVLRPLPFDRPDELVWIVGGVLGRVARVVGLGLALGLPLACVISSGFAALFFEVRPTDAWVYLIVAAVLTAFAILAAFVPARRASHVDPLLALRAE